jgi:DNA-binding NarL/FixJ family response regulator
VSDTAARWPRRQDYRTAIIKMETTGFKDKRLRDGRVERHPNIPTLPWPRSGTYGVVFKVMGTSADYAVKVFSKLQLDRQERYRLIDNYLKSIPEPLPSLVSFSYEDDGITVNEEKYPMLVMDWARGDTLDTYVAQQIVSVKGFDNKRACKNWIATVRELQNARIAHGDLQNKNILVLPGGGFKLVDYDGMFVPGMEGLAASEAGVSAFQHPDRARTLGHFDERMDDFSALVILLTLACMDAELWGLYHKADRLLLTEEDLREPDASLLLKRLSGRPVPVGALAGILKKAAQGTLDEIPAFESVIAEAGTEWAAGRSRRTDGARRAPRTSSPRQSPAAPASPPRAAEAAGTSQPGTLAGKDGLTDRQRQVAQLLAAGRSVGNIAATLGLRPATVAGHIAALEQKASGQRAEPRQASVATSATQQGPPAAPQRALTPRQQEVLALLRGGMLPTQIAGRLQVQLATVNNHLASIRAVIGSAELDALLAQAVAKQAAPKQKARRPVTPTVKNTAATKTANRQPQSRPVSPRPAASPVSARSPASPGRSRAGKAAQIIIVALIAFVILIVVASALS